jgi:transcriptional regulator with XRE-family HTH domain
MVKEKIKAARKRAKLSQQEVADKAELQRCQISDLERGILQLDHVHWGTIQKLCKVLDITPYDFMEPDNGRRIGHP